MTKYKTYHVILRLDSEDGYLEDITEVDAVDEEEARELGRTVFKESGYEAEIRDSDLTLEEQW